MAQWPWEYLFVALNAELGTFYTPFWVVNLALFIMTIVAYTVATRGTRGKGVLGDEWEYLLWIGVTTFGLNLVYAAFQWYGLFPIATTLVGFYLLRDTVVNRFPPQLAGEAAHEAMLRTRRQVSDGIEATLKRPNRRSGNKKR
ncbi:MAG: hypothetical protein DWI49_03475 [Chloroflexi bacterium]|jgi:hypothetical protein|nr:MAG: hypothetical protein DWI49_03475 [Chloroflexota bacterium]RLT26995.1 MAG: hypothetical protein DWI47_01650 [Chloroflexota bacterium]